MHDSGRFKLCGQCYSISHHSAPTCVVCGAYRFIANPAVVRRAARIMGQRPFPVTSGTIPRL